MAGVLFLVILVPSVQAADAPAPRPTHGLSLWDQLKYPENFTHFDYVNPHAPRGGAVKVAATGTFDSLNPFIVKGNKAPGAASVFESLMAGSLDEPQSYYGLVAKSALMAPDRSWVEFTLRPEARFHDGSPITADDVVFSFNTLKKNGDPTYRIQYEPIASAEKLDTYRVRFHFSDVSKRELPLIAAQVPILSKAYYTAHDFTQTTLTPPLSSGPYIIASVDPGHSITYARVKDYWGDGLPVNVGQNNFDSIRYDMYRDETVELQAFLAGEFDFREENIARVWASGYEGAALREGRIRKERIENKVPQGMQGFAFNTRRGKFADVRVREAIGLTLDFEWMNKSLFYGAYKRNKNYFLNTPYASEGLPDPQELALLEPFRAELPPGLFTQGFALPVTDGSGNNRPQLIRADRLLNDAGWIIRDGRRVNEKTNEPLTVEFLFQTPIYEKVASPMRRSLKKLGIEAGIRTVDEAQYIKRQETFDFDLTMLVVDRSVFYPGAEQLTWWHSSQASQQGSNNYVGVKSPAVDALIARITSAKTEAELRPAARALDRVLLWEHYMIPNWYLGAWRVAYWNKFGRPAIVPPYSLGFQAWWVLKEY
jgi:microcin C transport system substrate-binding protein